jgi:hypothetical protein
MALSRASLSVTLSLTGIKFASRWDDARSFDVGKDYIDIRRVRLRYLPKQLMLLTLRQKLFDLNDSHTITPFSCAKDAIRKSNGLLACASGERFDPAIWVERSLILADESGPRWKEFGRVGSRIDEIIGGLIISRHLLKLARLPVPPSGRQIHCDPSAIYAFFPPFSIGTACHRYLDPVTSITTAIGRFSYTCRHE